jgi:transcriptional regulator with GAF, ATPase, and Fis domain
MRHEGTEQLIGTSAVIAELSQEIDRIARSDAKVLITGESGVGKELVAHAIHQRSPRVARPMVAVNCAGLPETLLESELFGHVKGSFTGAYRDKQGKLEMADRGSIFLDEIGEMTLRMQGLLLRFMETGELQKVGADRIAGRVNVRVIAATNRNLRDMINEGTFREDLFYRLNIVPLILPPLRDRKDDIPVLAEHFLRKICKDLGVETKRLEPGVLDLLMHYHWPGNVRELEATLHRAVVMSDSDSLARSDFDALLGAAPVPRRPSPDGALNDLEITAETYEEMLSAADRQLIIRALEVSGGRIREAARRLGLARNTLKAKMLKYKIAAKD